MACAPSGVGQPELERCKLVVTNIPSSCSEETFSNYLESRLDKDVLDIKWEPGTPSVALVTFGQPVDVFECRLQLSAKPIADCTLEVDSIAVPQGVVAWGLQPSVSKQDIASILQELHPGEITLHASLGACIIPLGRERDIALAVDLLKDHCEHVEPHYDTFHEEVFRLLSAPPCENSPVKEQKETGNLVIRDISNEADSDSDSTQPSPDSSKPCSGSNFTYPQETKQGATLAEEPGKATNLPKSTLQEFPACHKIPPQTTSGNQVKTTTEHRQPAAQRKPAPKQPWTPKPAFSPKMASSPESSESVVPSAKDQFETVTIGVGQLGLLIGSGYFDSITKCSVTVHREAGSVTLAGPPGVTVAAKMELKFKMGTIQTETLTVGPEAVAKLKMASDPTWAAKPDEVYVDISDSGTVTCAAFTAEEKARAVEAIRSFLNLPEPANKPPAACTPVREVQGPGYAWGEGRVVERPLGKSAHKTPVHSDTLSEKDSTDNKWSQISGNQTPSSDKARDERWSPEVEISNEMVSQPSKNQGRGRWSPAENKENKPSHFGRGRGRGHHQSQWRNRDSYSPRQQKKNRGKEGESHPRPMENPTDRPSPSKTEDQAGGGKEVSTEPQKTQEFKLTGPKARCFLKHCSSNCKDIETKFRDSSGDWNLTQAGDEEELTIRLKGPQSAVTSTFRQLCDLGKRLWHEKILLERDLAHSKSVELSLLARGLRSEDNQLVLCGALEKKHKVCISFQLPPSDADKSLMAVARSAPPDAPEGREQARAASASPVPYRRHSHVDRGHHHGNSQRPRSGRHPGRRSSASQFDQRAGRTGAGYQPHAESPQRHGQFPHSFSIPEMHGAHGYKEHRQSFSRSPSFQSEQEIHWCDDFAGLLHGEDLPSEQPLSMTIKFGSSRIHLKQGNIASEKANVLVCCVGEDRKLENSAVGLAFLQAGGQEFKQNFEGMAGDSDSLVISSGGGQLQCHYVFTLVLKRFSRSSDKFLSKCVQNILEMATGFGADSIALPALGTGKRLAFPPDVVASSCVQAVASMAASSSAPRSVTFVVYDRECCQEFQQVLTSLENGSLPISSVVRTPSPPRRVTKPQSPERKPKTPPQPTRPSSGTVGGDGEVRTWNEAHVRIYGANKEDCQAAKDAITERVKKEFLNKVFIQRHLIGSLRQEARKEIVQAAAKEGVWVKFPEDRKKKHDVPKLTLQGESKAVLRAQNQIEKILEQVKSTMGTNPSARSVPKRGTPDFLKYMASKTDHQPPYYWDCYKPDELLASLLMGAKFAFQKFQKVKLDPAGKEYQEVAAVVMRTWRRDLAGHGKDARGLSHKSIEIKKIRRVENPTLFKKYAERRAHIFVKAAHMKNSFTRVEGLPNSSGPVLTTKHAGRNLERDMYSEVNEHYLLHGTKKDTVKGICANGIQSRLAGDKNMFGAGAYCAESSTKADQYADSKDNRTPGEKTMLLVRVVLGQPCLTSSPNNNYKLPPCKRRCGVDRCHHDDRFDSVIGDGSWNFREFVLFHEDQMYPEYIINYDRK